MLPCFLYTLGIKNERPTLATPGTLLPDEVPLKRQVLGFSKEEDDSVLSCTVWTYGVDRPARRKEGAALAVRSWTIRLYIADHLRGPTERTAKQFTPSVWPQIEANTFLNDHL